MPTNCIRDLLPFVGVKFPILAAELALFGRLLNDAPGALSEMPMGILTAGFEAIGLAPLLNATDKALAGDRSRRSQYIEAATFLRSEHHHTRPEHIFVAVRLWGAVLGRASLEYGGVGMHKRCDRPDKVPPKADAKMEAKAVELVTFVTRCALDVAVLVAEAERVRAQGREAYLRPVREFMAAHPEEKHVAPAPKPPSPQLDLFGGTCASPCPVSSLGGEALPSLAITETASGIEVISVLDSAVPEGPESTSPVFFYTADTMPPHMGAEMDLPAVLSTESTSEEEEPTDENTAPDPSAFAQFAHLGRAPADPQIQMEVE